MTLRSCVLSEEDNRGKMDVLTPIAEATRRWKSPSQLVEYSIVDAFTETAFAGNPAAVVLLPQPTFKDEKWMQQVSAEFNISQTVFLLKSKLALKSPGQTDEINAVDDQHHSKSGLKSQGHTDEVNGVDDQHHGHNAELENEYQIRWFTPTSEVNLCGHATLASAHVLFSTGMVACDTITFHSKSGKLIVRKLNEISEKDGKLTVQVPESVTEAKQNGVSEEDAKAPLQDNILELNFPMTKVSPADKSEIEHLATTLTGVEVISTARSERGDLILELASAEEVVALQPRVEELLQCSGRGVLWTARSSESNIDFVSRAFFPKLGVYEDPVCGSAHCALTPFWAEKLGKDSLEAHQVSKRGGRLSLRLDLHGGRVYLRGNAVTVMTGVIFL